MNPAEMKVALQEVLAAGISLNTASYIALGCLWFFGTIIGTVISGSVGAFFQKRGETAAVKADLETIKEQIRQTTEAAEKIRSEIGQHSAIAEQRWKLKLECYSGIVEAFAELAKLLSIEAGLEIEGPVRQP
jgi:hypothetical protein